MTRLPDGGGSTLPARIDLSLAVPPRDASAQLQTLHDRRTDRRRFTSWPVPEERLRDLAAAADEWGAEALPVLDPSARARTELLVGQAFDRQAADLRLSEEQLRWVDHSRGDGVPGEVISEAPRSEPSLRTRYATGRLHEGERELDGSDGLLIMRGGSDGIGAWLRTGEGLSALWLQATREGLSVVPLSQVIELDETRQRLRVDVLRRLGFPHILVRVG